MRKYLTMAQAAELLPIKRSVPTVWRWCAKGVYVRRVNKIIRLQHVYVGRRMMTTEAWLEEFIDQLTLAREAERKLRVLGRPGSRYDRIMQLYEADAVLRRAGFELPKPGDQLRQPGAQVRQERRE